MSETVLYDRFSHIGIIDNYASEGRIVSMPGGEVNFDNLQLAQNQTFLHNALNYLENRVNRGLLNDRILSFGSYSDTKGNKIPVLFTVPGQGVVGSHCLDTDGWLNCVSDDWKAPSRPNHCTNWTCPVDNKRVNGKQTRVIYEKMRKQTAAAFTKGFNFGKMDHYAISPKPGLYTLENWVSDDPSRNYTQFRRDVTKILNDMARSCYWDPDETGKNGKIKKHHGFFGGILVTHIHRWKSVNSVKWDPEDPESEEPGEKGEKIPVFSPHAHYIGYGFFNHDNKPKNWYFKNISAYDQVKGRNWSDTISYVLSHQQILMTVEKSDISGRFITSTRGLSYTWVGVLANNHGGRVIGSKKSDVIDLKCPKCNSQVHHIDHDGHDNGPRKVKIVSYDYYWMPTSRSNRRTVLTDDSNDLSHGKKPFSVLVHEKSSTVYHDLEIDTTVLMESSRKYSELGRYTEGWIDPVDSEGTIFKSPIVGGPHDRKTP